MTSTLRISQLSETDEARRRLGLKLFQYLRSGTPLGSDCPAVLLAARSSVKANLHAMEVFYLIQKTKEHYLKAQQALSNGDSEAAAKHLRKAKEIEALKNYEEKAAEAQGVAHLRALKKAMNTAQNFERSQLAQTEKHLEQKTILEVIKAQQLKQRQKKKLWSEALHLERQKFSAHILCHAPPAAKNNSELFTRQTFTNSRVMTGGCST